MNAIDTLITMANLRGSLDVPCQFQGDWALDHAPESLGVAPYHIVLSGTCHAELSGGQRVTLEEGDILLLPGGATHLLRSQGATVPAMLPRVFDDGVLKVHRLGGDQPEVEMLCGSFHYNRQSWLFAALPAYLVVSSRQW